MNTAILSLLQVTASFLMLIQHNPQATVAMQSQAVAAGSQVVQLVTQASANIPFALVRNNGIWPNVVDLGNSAYLNADGGWSRIGPNVEPSSSVIAFGDINGDGADDAVVLVKRTSVSGVSGFVLAAMLNQGGILFNIADVPVGNPVEVYSQQIQNGMFTIDMKAGNQPRAISRYALLGNRFTAQ